MLISLSFIFNCVHMNVSVHVLSPGAPNPEEGIFFLLLRASMTGDSGQPPIPPCEL